MNQTRCNPPLEDSELEKIAWSVCRYEPIQALALTMDGTPEVTFYTEEVTEIPDPGPLPVRFLNPPGLMGELIEWNLRTAPKPQPELALGAALALMSVLTGRKVEDQTGIRSNLYVIGLCASSGGKDHARRCNKQLLTLAGYRRLLGPETFKSDAGIVTMLHDQHTILCHVDEFGRYLASIKGEYQSPHIQGIMTMLLKMFTDSSSYYTGDAYGNKANSKPIDQPHLVIYGTSVPDNFWSGLSIESITDGFMGRMIAVEATNNNPRLRDDIEPEDPPQALMDMVKWWGEYVPGGNLSDITPQPRRLKYTDGARRQWRKLEDVCDAKREEQSRYCALYARSGEKAKKLALLYQCSMDPQSTEISEEAAEWGCSLIRYFHSKLEFRADKHIVASKHDAACKAVIQLIREHGKAITKIQLEKGSRRMGFQPKDIQAAIQSLSDSGEIEPVALPEKRNGRPPKIFRLPGTCISNEDSDNGSSGPIMTDKEEPQ